MVNYDPALQVEITTIKMVEIKYNFSPIPNTAIQQINRIEGTT